MDNYLGYKQVNWQKQLNKLSIKALIFLLISSFISPLCLSAQIACDDWVAKLASVEGIVQVQTQAQEQWQQADTGDVFCAGDRIKVIQSRAALLLPNDSVLRLNEATSIHFIPNEKSGWLELIKGAMHYMTRTRQQVEVKTPYQNAVIDGTELSISVDDISSEISVFEGTVSAKHPSGTLKVASGQTAVASKTQAPKLLTHTNLRDSVSWALYYPPVLGSSTIKQAMAKGKVNDALKHLSVVADNNRDADYYNVRASVELYYGKIQPAKLSLQKALNIANDHSVQKANSLALQSIIELIDGKPEQALQTATSSTKMAPQQSAPWVAMSYAQQGLFQLQAARKSAQSAVHADGDNALVVARLAELTLMTGDYHQAIALADKAVKLNDRLGRVHMILAYSRLSRFDLKEAKKSFITAAQLDPSDPLSQLGLGLVLIRQGDITTGRQHIELAAVLDPGNALVRSYLGKAYYEEHRNPLAAAQFELAQSLDANDPTPWFYSAILKQSEVKPYQALQALQHSQKLNDNRAVYRSRLMLDKDAASRSSNMARVYEFLGFDQLARQHGAEAVSQAPSEHSGHRLLAEHFANSPKFQSLRASESLQATLLQPLGAQPLALGLDESDLLVVDGSGPSDVAVNEFNPLFTRQGLNAYASLLSGENGTSSHDLLINGLYGKTAFSVGNYAYKSDGFRDNNDVDYEISNLFAQFQISPSLDIQFERRSREDIQGDLLQRFNNTFISENLRLNKEFDNTRLGMHYKLNSTSDLLFSYNKGDLNSLLADEIPIIPPVTIDEAKNVTHKYTQLLYLNNYENRILSVGAGVVERDSETITTIFDPFVAPIPIEFPPLADNSEYSHIYLYYTLGIAHGRIKLISGASHNSFETDRTDSLNRDIQEWKPKLGIEWQANDNLIFRSAWFKSVKPPLETIATLEPTHIAGFAQVFDDEEATESEAKGLAVDYDINNTMVAGIEMVQRKMDVDLISSTFMSREILNFDETRINSYLYYAISPNWSMSVNYDYENIDRMRGINILFTDVPLFLKTQVIPLSISYTKPNAYSIKLTGSFVEQKIETLELIGFTTTLPIETIYGPVRNNDSFSNVDVSINYYLPKRMGVFSLQVKNLLDEEFQFEDRNIQYNDNRPRVQRFYNERIVLGKLSINF